uniref:Protein ARV n=1 Tax=Parastrongyloides trichosuri TaxID=131310 RepID=A0A0N4ZH43_PARTI
MIFVSRKNNICINCGKSADNLYHQYNENIIRLSTCKYCNEYVDKYVEDDYPLICIDIFLQNIKAYRHVIINENAINRITVILVLLINETFVKWYSVSKEIEKEKAINDIHHFAAIFYMVSVQTLFEYIAYCVFLQLLYIIFTKKTIQLVNVVSFFNNCILGSYGYTYKTLVIIWNIEEHWSTITLISLMLIFSHIQIQRTLYPTLSKNLVSFCVIISLIFKEYVKYYISNHFIIKE